MPSGSLCILRPLYDIAVWQFLLMGEFTRTCGQKRGPEEGNKIILSFRVQEIVANSMCRLLEVRAFAHLQDDLDKPNIRAATGDWKVGEKATKKLVEWCQDQWRRKKPVLPIQLGTPVVAEPMCAPLFGAEMPLCHRCGTPCPECREELGQEIPAELSSALSVMDYEHRHNYTIEVESGEVAADVQSKAHTMELKRRQDKKNEVLYCPLQNVLSFECYYLIPILYHLAVVFCLYIARPHPIPKTV